MENTTTGDWKLSTLYKKDKNGKERAWSIEFLEASSQFVKSSGLSTGKPVITKTLVTPKVNRTLQEQARQEANTAFNNKIREGYSLDPESDESLKYAFFQPSLSDDYDPKRTNMSKKVILQEKLDGVRDSCYVLKGLIVHKTRNNLEYSHLGHLDAGLTTVFGELPEGSMVDGEIYRHKEGYSQQTISSIVRTGVGKDGSLVGTPHPKIIKLEFWIFDFKSVVPMTMEKRAKTLNRIRKKFQDNKAFQASGIRIIHSIMRENTPQNIIDRRYKFEKQGYEGLMVKMVSDGETEGPLYTQSLYLSGRSRNTLKCKKSDVDVCEVMEVIESKKRVELCILEVKDIDRGCTFRLSHGSNEQKQKWLINPKEILGKKITYNHFGFTDAGIPRCPTTSSKDLSMVGGKCEIMSVKTVESVNIYKVKDKITKRVFNISSKRVYEPETFMTYCCFGLDDNSNPYCPLFESTTAI